MDGHRDLPSRPEHKEPRKEVIPHRKDRKIDDDVRIYGGSAHNLEARDVRGNMATLKEAGEWNVSVPSNLN
jgi:hypothetical protein